jgi:hypothetical protein
MSPVELWTFHPPRQMSASGGSDRLNTRASELAAIVVQRIFLVDVPERRGADIIWTFARQCAPRHGPSRCSAPGDRASEAGCDRLRSQINSIGHKGHLKKELDKDAMAELLTAALFGCRYVQLLQLAVEGKLRF